MKKTARLITLLLVISYWLLVSTKPVAAQTTQPSQDTHTYVQTVMLDVMAALSCNLAGIDPTGASKKCLGYNQQTGELGFIEHGNGAIGAMGGLIAVLYNPPLSSSEYFNYLARNFGIAKPAYAQGTGFEGLKPLLALWTVFRNLVYILFAVAFVIVGFAIMLRVRIDPRTVMTIQNQIPKLIIALLFVTFSYAIAGFLIDFMYVTIYLLFGVVGTIGTPGTANLVSKLQNFQGVSPIDYANELPGGFLGIVTNVAGAVKDMLLNTIFAGPIGNIVAGVIGGALGLGVGGVRVPGGAEGAGGTVGGAVGGAICAVTGVGVLAIPICAAAGSLLGTFITTILAGAAAATIGKEAVLTGVAGFLAFLIIGIAVLWSLFRLWFQLIMAYVLLLLDVVFAPFWMLVGVFPGAPIGFGAWLRSILSNLSVYPVTIAMFILAKVFMESFQHVANTAGGKAFMPPLIGNPGDNTYGALASFIGLGFILLTPQVVTMVKDYLKAPVFKYLPAVGQAIGVGTGGIGGVFTQTFHPFGALAIFRQFRTQGGFPGLLRGVAGFGTGGGSETQPAVTGAGKQETAPGGG